MLINVVGMLKVYITGYVSDKVQPSVACSCQSDIHRTQKVYFTPSMAEVSLYPLSP
ncbi:hypothetical protein ESTG_02919, partial [Escherichia coli B799]